MVVTFASLNLFIVMYISIIVGHHAQFKEGRGSKYTGDETSEVLSMFSSRVAPCSIVFVKVYNILTPLFSLLLTVGNSGN